MTTTAPYTEQLSTLGAWACSVLLPQTPFDAVRTLLSDLTTYTGTPLNAFLPGDGDLVTELLLVRDPNPTYGTSPDIATCEAFAQLLAAETGWPRVPQRVPSTGVVVGLGLREGNAPDTPQHALAEAHALLAEHGDGWRCDSAHLVSARLVNGSVRWHDELGVIVYADAVLVPVIERIAALFAQDRFVITDFSTGSTRVLTRRITA
ncbi:MULTISPECIES: hypothetical protein [unclassified Crossiella]|uniref:hypothetical protein n=1 Tax=unclassified Crossiella TaxID=2620835 RepID=UPI001FFFF2C1|nr:MULTISPECIES: hypothetical protein [unclassified Crossiella]MCK2245235.1 hypothetical protein [Crossiella sp. S99.2]MCK2258843.1 hypothetical protein [Crossiella sp. S99.1]